MTRSPPASADDGAGPLPDVTPDTPGSGPDTGPDTAPDTPGTAPDTAAPDADQTLDVRGLMCPLPVLKARKVLKRLAPGATLAVLATDPASVIDFRHFCETTPFELLGWREQAGTYAFRIRAPG